MVFQMTNHLEVLDVIKQMKNKKSSGCDGVDNEILKYSSLVVENTITNSFNGRIEKKFFPKF